MLPDDLRAIHDPPRLNALAQTGLLDSGPEEAFDRLTRLAARVSGTPLSLVNLIAADRQFSKSCFAPDGWPKESSLPLADSFCKYAVGSREPLAIRDARQDSRVCSSRMVTHQGLVSYLGIPLITSGGHVLGTLCVGDIRPREWTLDDIEGLNDLAVSVVTEIELRAQVRETEEAEQLADVAERERRDADQRRSAGERQFTGSISRGRCTFLNAAGAEMLRYAYPGRVPGAKHARADPSHRCRWNAVPGSKCPVFRAFQKGEAVRMQDEVLWRNDGTSFVALYSSSPIWEGSGQGAVVTFSDITERKRNEDTQQFFSRASKLTHAESTLRLHRHAPDADPAFRSRTRRLVQPLHAREDGGIEQPGDRPRTRRSRSPRNCGTTRLTRRARIRARGAANRSPFWSLRSRIHWWKGLPRTAGTCTCKHRQRNAFRNGGSAQGARAHAGIADLRASESARRYGSRPGSRAGVRPSRGSRGGQCPAISPVTGSQPHQGRVPCRCWFPTSCARPSTR